MNIYIETLQQLFETLPAIADSEGMIQHQQAQADIMTCLLYTSPSPRDRG